MRADRREPIRKGPTFAAPGLCVDYRLAPLINKVARCNHITMHGSLTVNGRTVIVHVGDGEANATVDGTHFNVRSLWQLYQLLRLLV